MRRLQRLRRLRGLRRLVFFGWRYRRLRLNQSERQEAGRQRKGDPCSRLLECLRLQQLRRSLPRRLPWSKLFALLAWTPVRAAASPERKDASALRRNIETGPGTASPPYRGPSSDTNYSRPHRPAPCPDKPTHMPSSRDIFKNIHRNSKGLINYYINSQIPFPANSNQYRFNNEFLSNQKL